MNIFVLQWHIRIKDSGIFYKTMVYKWKRLTIPIPNLIPAYLVHLLWFIFSLSPQQTHHMHSPHALLLGLQLLNIFPISPKTDQVHHIFYLSLQHSHLGPWGCITFKKCRFWLYVEKFYEGFSLAGTGIWWSYAL